MSAAYVFLSFLSLWSIQLLLVSQRDISPSLSLARESRANQSRALVRRFQISYQARFRAGDIL